MLDWASIATISNNSFPLANLKSISDGPIDNSSGIPYFYMTPWDLSGHDLSVFMLLFMLKKQYLNFELFLDK